MQIHGRFAASFLEAGDVLEATDRHAQVQFGEERFQEVGQALGAAVGQGVCVGPADADGRGAPRQCDHGICRIPYAGVEHDRSGAGRRHDAGQELERRNSRIRLATTMIGAVQHIGAIVDRHPGIIGVLNPFHRDRQIGLRPNPTEVFPRQRVLEDLPVVLQRGGLILVGWLCEVFGEVLVGVVVLHAEAAELREVAQLQIRRPVAKSPRIDGQHQRGISAGFSTVDEARRQLPISWQIQLVEVRRGPGVFDDILHRGLGERRQGKRHPGGGRRLCCGHISLEVRRAQADQADGAHEDRRVEMLVEQRDRQVTLGRADHHPGSDSVA